MDENYKLIAERILSLSEDERQRLFCLTNPIWMEYRKARSKKKRNRCLGDYNAVLNEFCLDVVAVDKSLP